jgi:hypothetical protein
MSAQGARLRALFLQAWGGSLEQLCRATEPLALASFDDASRSQVRQEAKLATLPASLLDELVEWLWSRNQFLVLDSAAKQELLATLESALGELSAQSDLEGALARHRAELASFVRARLGPEPRDVVSAEYSPELQLRVLGLAIETLKAPVLDVGCGPQAALVRALRSSGLSARGLDRLAPTELGSRDDWLTFAYGTARWGTVLSHLGFSLHFLHHHLARRDSAYAYARVYMAILRALAVGGRFVYTPGLPFVETLLEASTYRVHHVPFAAELRVDSLVAIEQQTGLALSHATHVERLV